MYRPLKSILEQLHRGIDGVQDLKGEAKPQAANEPAARPPAPAVELAAG
jgi:hypothetical protein